MYNHQREVLRTAALLAAVCLGAVACDKGSPTDPAAVRVPDLEPLAALGSTAYPGVKTGGKVIVCKDASSPGGVYQFHVSATPIQAGDLVAAVVVNLTPGTCSVVWERPTVGGPIANVTAQEVIPGGATFTLDHIIAVDDFSGTRNVPGPGVTVQVNGYHGSVITFFNVAAVGGTGHHAPPPPPPPPPPHGEGDPHHPPVGTGDPHHTAGGTSNGHH